LTKHYNITVTGKVQGVFYRAFTQKEAQRLHVLGFVRNQPNGDVYIEAEGEEAVLQEFISWCKKGSPTSVVKEVRAQEAELKKFSEFKIDR
jgi:acylphosphatase